MDAYALRREHGCLEPLGRNDVSFFAGTRNAAIDFEAYQMPHAKIG